MGIAARPRILPYLRMNQGSVRGLCVLNMDVPTAIEEFLSRLAATSSEETLLDFCRRHSLHGTPVVFNGNEDHYYEFRKRIASNFDISFHEVFITGSAKLGFNPREKTPFNYESDIDVAIISAGLYGRIMSSIHDYHDFGILNWPTSAVCCGPPSQRTGTLDRA
jgi:hypothetical protein